MLSNQRKLGVNFKRCKPWLIVTLVDFIDVSPAVNVNFRIDKMNSMIEEYAKKSSPEYCAKAGMVDEIVDLPKLRNYAVAFADAAYQNPKHICPVHQMILPRIILDYDHEHPF